MRIFFIAVNLESMKGLGIGVILAIFTQITASYPFIAYTVMIFKTAGTSIDPYVASILFAMALIFGTSLSTFVVDILGRKLTNIISLMGAAFGLLVLSAYQYFRLNGYDLSEYTWIPIACVSLVICMSSAGIIPLSMVCAVEYVSPKVYQFLYLK